MKTEEEARKCWCPFARSAWGINPSDDHAALCTANRGNTDSTCRCIASECMAWRWVFKPPETKYQLEKPEGEGWEPGLGSVPSPARNINWVRPVAPTHGFCGLAEPTECYGGCNYS